MQTQSYQRRDVSGSKADVVTKHMSEAMVEIGEGCAASDLKRLGFSQRDIDRHGEAAAARAARLAQIN